jgi:glycosyltransferase involved in cell wall biosynthesis
VERLLNHHELGRRLFWLEGISDEYLEKVYAASTCLIAASEGEGFGLPLIEAAQHGIPIIARDIPVFREIAGDYAFYFRNTESGVLACAIRDWLALFEAGRHPKSNALPRLTWRESTEVLKRVIFEGDWYGKFGKSSSVVKLDGDIDSKGNMHGLKIQTSKH